MLSLYNAITVSSIHTATLRPSSSVIYSMESDSSQPPSGTMRIYSSEGEEGDARDAVIGVILIIGIATIGVAQCRPRDRLVLECRDRMYAAAIEMHAHARKRIRCGAARRGSVKRSSLSE